uniref:Uncharacterized protein n=1 Tax=Anguilla anguilla TaxID=7936 RepID=A0A0E9T0I1_ANGAN
MGKSQRRAPCSTWRLCRKMGSIHAEDS